MSTPAPLEITPISVQPLDKMDIMLRESFAKDIVEQVTRMDELGKQLITLNLGIPALYGAVLKLTEGEKAVFTDATPFLFWVVALFFAFAVLIPIKQTVDQDSLTDIQNYFCRTARRKWLLVIGSTLFSFIGIFTAVLSIF